MNGETAISEKFVFLWQNRIETMLDYNLQLFYCGLNEALSGGWNESFPIPDGGKGVFTSTTIDHSFHYVLLHSLKNCRLDTFKRLILHLEKNGLYSNNDDFRRLTSGEIYKVLSGLSLNNASELLNRIGCTDGVYSELIKALDKKDKKRFVDALYECNTSNISSSLACIFFLQSEGRRFEEEKKKAFGGSSAEFQKSIIQSMLDVLKTSEKSINDVIRELRNEIEDSLSSVINSLHNLSTPQEKNLPKLHEEEILTKLDEIERSFNTSMKDNNNSDGISDDDRLCSLKYYTFFFQYCRLKDDGVLDHSATRAFEYLFRLPSVKEKYDVGMRCWNNGCWMEKLLEFESRLQDATSDVGKKAINEIEPPEPTSTPAPEPDQEDKTDSIGHLFPRSKYEFVPENYFDPECVSKGYIEEHYELVDRVKKHGLLAFVNFINYIANEGFIENDDETKALLAYRLTGRMRPEKQKLDKIIWFKEKGEPKELYYVIKYFSPRSRTKFSKQMKEYFENDYFGVDCYSRTAEDVSDGFKDKLENFFPGLTNTSKG